jgi:predicted DNA-binding transcriptional regulator AlpA
MANNAAFKDRAIPHELTHFDKLPDSAHVRLPVVAGLYGCSFPTIWRNVKAGKIPAPVKLTENCTAWNVGQLRKALAGRAA